jgi:hypothetical protein
MGTTELSIRIPVRLPRAVADLPREHRGTQILVFRQASRV